MVPYHNHSTHWGRSWFSNVTLTPAFFRQPIQTQLKQLDRLSAGDASLRHWERNLIAKEKAGMQVSWASFTERWSRIPAYRHHLSPQEELERLVRQIRRTELALLETLALDTALARSFWVAR